MDVDQPTISAEDFALLQLLKKEMKDVPKGDNPTALKQWMKDYLVASGELEPKSEVKKEPDVEKDVESKQIKPKTSKIREPPRITNFSGSNAKGETSYELWRYEVTGLLADQLYDKENINYAVRRSLKGDAGVIAMHLGAHATVADIIHKLDSIYGDVEKKEDLLAQFYRARQGEDESITKWSCRLESIMGRAVEKGIVKPTDRNSMLHTMLWTGLRTELKDISGHKFDSIKDFDELRIALRHIEKDHEERRTIKPHTAKAAATPEPIQQSQMDEFRGLIHQLTTRMDRWETEFSSRGRGYRPNYNKRGRGQQQYQQPRQSYQEQPQQARQPPPEQQGSKPRRKETMCYRCKKYGHIRKGCTAILDEEPRLNEKKPMEQDRR